MENEQSAESVFSTHKFLVDLVQSQFDVQFK